MPWTWPLGMEVVWRAGSTGAHAGSHPGPRGSSGWRDMTRRWLDGRFLSPTGHSPGSFSAGWPWAGGEEGRQQQVRSGSSGPVWEGAREVFAKMVSGSEAEVVSRAGAWASLGEEKGDEESASGGLVGLGVLSGCTLNFLSRLALLLSSPWGSAEGRLHGARVKRRGAGVCPRAEPSVTRHTDGPWKHGLTGGRSRALPAFRPRVLRRACHGGQASARDALPAPLRWSVLAAGFAPTLYLFVVE